jgi:hypothetical protein
MIIDRLLTKTRIIRRNSIRIKECADVLRRASEVQSEGGPYQTAIQYRETWKLFLISVTAIHA